MGVKIGIDSLEENILIVCIFFYLLHRFTKEEMHCCYKACLLLTPLSDAEDRVEIKTVLPKSKHVSLSKFMVKWQKNGEAEFHKTCWNIVLKLARARSKKKDVPKMTCEEKVLVKEAAKTAEKFDSITTIISEAKRVADMIKSSSHCVAFTGIQ